MKSEKGFGAFTDLVRGRSVSVIGLGISNLPLVGMISSLGASRVTARDRKEKLDPETEAELKKYKDVSVVLGGGYLDGIRDDIVIRAPGLRPDKITAKLPDGARPVITSEMELFFKYCPCRITAITGSAGKTTTTTLVYELLKKAGKNVFLGGNIGFPLLPRLEMIKPDDEVVCELSSFQLFDMDVSPDVCVVTNVSENHLDWHTSMDEYIAAKKNIFRFQKKSGICVLNRLDPVVSAFESEIPGKARFFSSAGKRDIKDGVFMEGGVIFSVKDGKAEKLLDRSVLRVPGDHNAENLMAAYCAVREIVSKDDLFSVASAFKGVPHRLELCGEKDGVKYYNSSIDSSPLRTVAALSTFGKRAVVLCGGYDKHLDYSPLGDVLCEKAKAVVLCGATSEKIRRAILSSSRYEENRDKIRIFSETDFEKAVYCCRDCAEKGDPVVLSPASASFDMFRNFEERGNRFKEIVSKIVNEKAE